MAAALAILFGLIGSTYAASCPDSKSPQASYQWVNLTDIDETYVSKATLDGMVDAAKALNWNIELIQDVPSHQKVDLQVFSVGPSGTWTKTQDITNADLCNNISDTYSAYATLLGLQNSKPPLQLENGQSAVKCLVSKGKLALQGFLPSASQLASPSIPTGKQVVQLNFKGEDDMKPVIRMSFLIDITC